jgi:hypothetical protein
MSDYLESGLIQHLFRTGSFTKPSVIAIALCSGTVTQTDTGALLTKELGGGGTPGSPPGGYNRQTLNPSDSNWSAITQTGASSGLTDNLSAITFGPATADWGTVTYLAITDNSGYGSGNVLMFAPVTTPKTIQNGDSITIGIGNLDIYFD